MQSGSIRWPGPEHRDINAIDGQVDKFVGQLIDVLVT